MKKTDPAELLKQTLVQKTQTSDDFDIVDVVPIPMHGDRMVRLRTLEEAMSDFDQGNEPTSSMMGYFVQIKPRRAPAPELPPEPVSSSEGIYKTDGQLNLPFLIRSAEMLYSSGDYALARNIYKAIIQSGEKTGAGLLGMARCYESEGKIEEARINYEESIAYHPQPEAYRALTALLIRQKKDQQAAEVIERALHHRDLSTENRYELHKTAGNCWSRLGNAKDAELHYRKALEIKPSADEIRTNLGALFLQCGRNDEAERYFNDALASNPSSHQALTGLGSCALAEGNKLAAHAWFARSLQVELKNPTAIFHLVKCAYAIKQYAVAAKVLEDYIQVAPVNAHLLYSLAGLQFHLGRMADARMTCIQILQLDLEHSGARELLSRIEGISPGGA